MPPKKRRDKVVIYDCTLRDGAQAQGVAFSLEDKLLIARKLDELGVDYIEGGYPLSNPKDEAFFREMHRTKLRHAKIAAFGMTRKKNTPVGDDPGIAALLKSKAAVVTIVAKADEFHVRKVLGTTLAQNLKMVEDSVKYCCRRGREVVFDAEHFYDGYMRNDKAALAILTAALQAGATTLCLCDTNGGGLPDDIRRITHDVIQAFGNEAVIGFHGHNDSALAVANSLAALETGVQHVQGTINGIGERCGNADLTAIIPNLVLKLGRRALPKPLHLQKLTEVSRYVYEMANLNLSEHQPFVGTAAFAHKGGMHVHAILRDTASYEHIEPEQVGNTRKVLVSELSGASNVLAKSGLIKQLQDKTVIRKVLNKLQDLENAGYQFEAAEASFHLLTLKILGKYKKAFDLDHYRVVILKRNAQAAATEAIVKLAVNGHTEHAVAEGDGPVNALDGALRKALAPYYSEIDDTHLVDYKVRIVNPRAGTAAKTRVIIESSDGREHWGTTGVSDNIVDASWEALVDAIEYKICRDRQLGK